MLEKETLILSAFAQLHGAQLRSGLWHGWCKRNLAEKPISLSLEEGCMVMSAKETVSSCSQLARRWNPSLVRRENSLTKGENCRCALAGNVYAQCVSHNGSHAIDILRYMAGGNVQWVFGEMQSDEAAAGENDLMGNGYLVFDNGVRAYLRSTSCGAAPWEVDVIGSGGRIRSINNAEKFELIRVLPGGRRGRGVPATCPFPYPNRMQGMGIDYC